MRNRKGVWWFIGAVIVLILIVGSILLFGSGRKEDEIIIGVILPGSADEPGWNGIHYQGIKDACDALGLKIELHENALEYSGECEKAVRRMAEKGIKVIILESYNYPDEIAETIEEFPDISFYCCSLNIGLDNYQSYFPRVYQARYLSGIIAGMKTESNHIGYVAAMDNSEVNRGINAFTLGVRSVNPVAVVHVCYTGDWDNEEKEKQAAASLVDNCMADVLAYHQNQTFVVDTAEQMGIYSIGYNIDQGEYSDNLLTCVSSNWDMVYREIIGDYLRNKKVVAQDYWIGIEKDAVGLSFYSDEVSHEMIAAVEQATEQLCNNREVFAGPIYDNQGNIRCSENEVIRDKVLRQQMDWLVEGVEIYEVN